MEDNFDNSVFYRTYRTVVNSWGGIIFKMKEDKYKIKKTIKGRTRTSRRRIL